MYGAGGLRLRDPADGPVEQAGGVDHRVLASFSACFAGVTWR